PPCHRVSVSAWHGVWESRCALVRGGGGGVVGWWGGGVVGRWGGGEVGSQKSEVRSQKSEVTEN
ncbi:MAG: hypothetical protein VKK42_07435, partial [Lyngbya sp.]|nr:hypothetical protein [Lyngbya sp.]